MRDRQIKAIDNNQNQTEAVARITSRSFVGFAVS